jgi:hypothetical protein
MAGKIAEAACDSKAIYRSAILQRNFGLCRSGLSVEASSGKNIGLTLLLLNQIQL